MSNLLSAVVMLIALLAVGLLLVISGLGIVFLSLVLPKPIAKPKRPTFQKPASADGLEERNEPVEPEIVLEEWNEQKINQALDSNQPESVILYYAAAVANRFIKGQDIKTAKRRSEFLRAKLEEIRLAKELRGEYASLAYMQTEDEIRNLELEARRKTTENNLRDQEELAELERQEKKLAAQLRIATLQKQIKDVNKEPEKSPPPPPQPTAEELRVQAKAKCEAKIERLQKEMAEKLATIEDEEERMRWHNYYADVIEREMQELKKYL